MKKCNFQPSIFEPAKATMSGQSKTDKDDTLTPRPLVTPDLYGTWQSECKYIHHGSAKYKHSCALNIHLPTSPIILLLQQKENISIASPHQQKIFPSGRNGSVRVDALRQSHQRHPGGGLLRARPQYHASRCISPSDRCFTVSSCSVGLLF